MLQTSHLQIALQVRDEIAVLTLRGRLDLPLDADLLRTMERLVDEGFRQVVADCRGLDYLCSRGISTFLAVLDDLRERGGDLKLVCDSPRTVVLLDRLGLSRIVQRFDTPEAAVRAFATPIAEYLAAGGLEEFVASVRASLFHAASCPRARRILRRQTFPSKKAAREAGKRPCRHCCP